MLYRQLFPFISLHSPYQVLSLLIIIQCLLGLGTDLVGSWYGPSTDKNQDDTGQKPERYKNDIIEFVMLDLAGANTSNQVTFALLQNKIGTETRG